MGKPLSDLAARQVDQHWYRHAHEFIPELIEDAQSLLDELQRKYREIAINIALTMQYIKTLKTQKEPVWENYDG